MNQNRNSEQQLLNGLQQIMDNSLDVICVADAEGYFVQVSNNCQKVWGYKSEEIIGTSYQSLLHPDDLLKSLDVVDKLKEEGVVKDFENRFRMPDGTYFPIIWSIYWSAQESLMYGLAKSGIEKQENKKKLLAYEEKMNRFLTSTQEGIYTLDTNYNFDLINSTGEKLLEKMTGKKVRPGDNLLETVPPHRKEAVQKMYAPVFNGQNLDYEIDYKTSQGKVWLSVHIDPLIGETGKVTGLIVSTRDITERKKTEERLQLALAAGQIGIWELDLVKDTSIRNPRHDQIFGYQEPLAKWGARQFFEHVFLEDRPMVQKAFDEALQSYQLSFECRIVWPDGSIRWITTIGKVVPDEFDKRQKPVSMLGTVIDITQRKKGEEETRKANERFNLAAEASFDVIYDLNLETNTVYVNDAIKKLLDYPSGENFDVEDMRKCIHPDDKEAYLNNLRNFLQSKELYFVHEHRLMRMNGEVVYITMKALAVRRPDGAPYRVVGILRDITEQKISEATLLESEERYRLFFEHNLDAILLTAPDGSVLDANAQAMRLLGYSLEELRQVGRAGVVDTSDPKLAAALIERRETGKYRGELTMIHKTGRKLLCEISTVIYKNSDGEERTHMIIHDITEKKKAQEEIIRINEELHLLSSHLQNVREEERINIAREIHDDLGQQLTGLKMDVFWLTKRLQTENELIKEKTKTIMALIDEIVKSVRRISSNLRPSILDDLGLVPALEWHSKEVERRAEIKVNFTSTVEAEIPSHLTTGLFRIYQEALTNAVRHANAHVVVSNLKLNDDTLVLTIKDDGQGMDLSKVFAKKTLGLIGIKERVYLLGGQLELQSQPGLGTEIKVTVHLNAIRN